MIRKVHETISRMNQIVERFEWYTYSHIMSGRSLPKSEQLDRILETDFTKNVKYTKVVVPLLIIQDGQERT